MVLSEYWHVNNLLGVIREFEAFRETICTLYEKLRKGKKVEREGEK